MNKFAIPAILAVTVMVAGMFAFMPVEQASTVHSTMSAGPSTTVTEGNNDSVFDTDDTDWYVIECTSICFINDITVTGTLTGAEDESADYMELGYMYTISSEYASTEAGLNAAFADDRYFEFSYLGDYSIVEGDDDEQTLSISLNAVLRDNGYTGGGPYILSPTDKIVMEIQTFEDGDDSMDYDYSIIVYVTSGADDMTITPLLDVGSNFP